MIRFGRAFIASTLAVATIAVPLVVLHCAISCEASESAAAPSCHHDAGATGLTVQAFPTACVHDYSPSASIAPVRMALIASRSIAQPAVLPLPHPLRTAENWIDLHASDSSPTSPPVTHAQPLRI